jgi:hypothetical protein
MRQQLESTKMTSSGKNGTNDQRMPELIDHQIRWLNGLITSHWEKCIIFGERWSIWPIFPANQISIRLTRLVLSYQTGLPNWRGHELGHKLRFEFEPGCKWKYSGEGYEYLREAIESFCRRIYYYRLYK